MMTREYFHRIGKKREELVLPSRVEMQVMRRAVRARVFVFHLSFNCFKSFEISLKFLAGRLLDYTL